MGCTDGSWTYSSGTDGASTDDFSTDVSGTDGTGTDGTSTDGTSTDETSTDSTSTDSSSTDGSGTDGSREATTETGSVEGGAGPIGAWLTVDVDCVVKAGRKGSAVDWLKFRVTCTIVEEIEGQISPIHCPDKFPGIIILKEMRELCHCIGSTHNPHNAAAEVSFYL
jgi:hypothetical protein